MARARALALGAAVALGAVASCGVRAPSRIDHAALVNRYGPVEARRTLELRILHDPRDLGARLAVAALSEQVGRPSGAIEQLEAVVATGGPLGTRWHADDRARLARLVAARGRTRLARGAPTALGDLRRARELGGAIDDRDLARAELAHAIMRLRHVDGRERAAGRALLRALAGTPVDNPAWRGAAAQAAPAERGGFGVWLWSIGARRAAWDELAAWHAATAPPRDPGLQSAYLVALGWWSPYDAPPPPPSELIGAARCRFDGAACDPRQLAELGDTSALAALVTAPPRRVTTPNEAFGWLAITLTETLRGGPSWGPSFAARVDVDAISIDQLPAGVRAAFAAIAGRADPGLDPAPDAGLPAPSRLLVAAGRALGGGSAAEVSAALGPLADSDDGRALLRVVAVPAPPPIAHPFVTAVVDHVRARVPSGPGAAAIQRLAEAYVRDPAITDRLARDVIAEAPDDAVAHAALGALFDALADPARARGAWQAAVDASPEPSFLCGLADAIARTRDPDAALVAGTAAAAASGDPAVVWVAVARALDEVGAYVHALEAARYAIELAGPDQIAGAFDVAIDASRALGRTAQAAALVTRRATVSPPPLVARDGDPTDAAAALAAHRSHPTTGTAAKLWVAARWNPRDVALRAALRAVLASDDPRRPVIDAELVALAADLDPEVGRAAVAALRIAGPGGLAPMPIR